MKKRLGILGGTFHPVHWGHIEMARAAKEALDLDSVCLMVDRIPPHKALDEGATAKQRYEMAALAAKEADGLWASDFELKRQGKSYTADTLEALQEKYPDSELYFIMGSDMLRSLTSWYRPESICALAALVCICRAGEQGGEEAAAEQLKLLYNARVKLLPPVRQLSSTEIRKRLWEAKPVSALVPPAVERYIYENGLYMGEDIALTTQKLRSSLKESRFRHVIGVEITAIALADRLGADGERARLAALLHDCAKGLSEEEQYALALLDGDDGLMPTDVAAVVHAPAGAVLARKEYGVTDEEVLKAIRYHTTGEKSMSLLDKILWAADLIEPGRSYPGADRLRKELLNVETPEEFDRALALAFKENLCYIQKNNSILHPATLRAYEDLIKRTKERN